MFNRRCQVCKHPERLRVEFLRASGASLDSLAEKFKLDRDAIWRHWHNHVSAEAKASYLAGPAALADLGERAAEAGVSVLDYLGLVRTTLLAQLGSLNEAGDGKGCAVVAGKLVQLLELQAKLSGELGTLAASVTNNFSVTTNNVAVLESPQWLRTQATILRALSPFPEARAAVVTALRGAETPPPMLEAAHVA